MRGLDYRPDAKAWRVHIAVNGHRLYLGYYKTEAEAEEIRILAEQICGKPFKGPKVQPSTILIDREIAFVEVFTSKASDLWAVIDSEDVPIVTGHRWSSSKGYADNWGIGLMHRLLMGPENPMDIDHKDHNRLNNRRHNLRFCTVSQNMLNTTPTRCGPSGVRGVSQCRDSGRWWAQITIDKKRHHLGYFKTKEEAIEARRTAEYDLGVRMR
jgi:hypothetical protein